MNDKVLPPSYIMDELTDAVEYFVEQNKYPTAISRSGDGTFTVTFTNTKDKEEGSS